MTADFLLSLAQAITKGLLTGMVYGLMALGLSSMGRLESRVMPTLDACRRDLLKMTFRRALLACSQRGQALTHRMCVAQIPCVSKSCRTCARFWPRIQGPPTRTFVLWCRAVILPAPSYHQPSLMTGGGAGIPPTWPLAHLSPWSIAPPPPTWPTECALPSY